MIRINDQQFWRYTAADPQSNELLHVRLFATTTATLTEIFLPKLRQKHNVETSVFLVDCAQRLQIAFQQAGLRFRMCRHRNQNAIEQIFRGLRSVEPRRGRVEIEELLEVRNLVGVGKVDADFLDRVVSGELVDVGRWVAVAPSWLSAVSRVAIGARFAPSELARGVAGFLLDVLQYGRFPEGCNIISLL